MNPHHASWRAAVDAASEVLADKLGCTVSTLDRQAIAFEIGQRVVAKLSAAPVRRWTGLLGEPCWVCGRSYVEHLRDACPDADAPAADAQQVVRS